MKPFLVISVYIVVGLVGSKGDLCREFLMQNFVSESCDERSRDTVAQLVAAGRGYLSGMDPCSCDSTALFMTYFFSSAAYMSSLSRLPVTNATLALFQAQTGLQTYDSAPWLPHVGCTVPSAESARSTLQQIACLLGVSPACAGDSAARLIVQVYLQSPLLGTGHTFVLQRAPDGVYYLYQGFIGDYDLYMWLTQQSLDTRERSAFADALNATTVAHFLALLEPLVVGKQPWSSVAPHWRTLFWTTPPMPPHETRCGRATSSDPIPIGVAFWQQRYIPSFCSASLPSLRTAWDDTHEKLRQHMCGPPVPPIKPCSQSESHSPNPNAFHQRMEFHMQ